MHETPHPSFPIWFAKKEKAICLLQTAWRFCSWCFCFACQVDVFCFACGRCEEMRRKILSSDAMLRLFSFKLPWRAPQRSLIFHVHTIHFINSPTQQRFTEYIAVEQSFWSRKHNCFLSLLTARTALSRSTKSASLSNRRPLSEASILLHTDPREKARRAACTALSISTCELKKRLN